MDGQINLKYIDVVNSVMWPPMLFGSYQCMHGALFGIRPKHVGVVLMYILKFSLCISWGIKNFDSTKQHGIYAEK